MQKVVILLDYEDKNICIKYLSYLLRGEDHWLLELLNLFYCPNITIGAPILLSK